MRRRLALLFVLASTAAGCSLLVEFDRGKIVDTGSNAEDASSDGEVDGAADSSSDSASDAVSTIDASDGGADVEVTDANENDGQVANDGSTDAGPDVIDSGHDAEANDAGVDASKNDAGTDASASDADTTPDANAPDAADAADAADADIADANLSANCSQSDFDAHDLTSQSDVSIVFPSDGNPAQYSPNCVKVSANTIVTFTGNFSAHPLTAGGGSANSPIPVSVTAASDGGDVGDFPVTFTAAGTYDFACGMHPSLMFGGVQVVP